MLTITAETLKRMDLCGNHHAQNATAFVGEFREITPGSILCALEKGVDVLYFIDYWLREDAGKGLGVGPKGKIHDDLLWIYDEMMEGLHEVYKNSLSRHHEDQMKRALIYHTAFECLWMNKRWVL